VSGLRRSNSSYLKVITARFRLRALPSFIISRRCLVRMGRLGFRGVEIWDCALVAAAPVLPGGYVVSAGRIADRRMILAGYRLADLLKRVRDN
jgi:hypothetical protein